MVVGKLFRSAGGDVAGAYLLCAAAARLPRAGHDVGGPDRRAHRGLEFHRQCKPQSIHCRPVVAVPHLRQYLCRFTDQADETTVEPHRALCYFKISFIRLIAECHARARRQFPTIIEITE